MEIFKQYSNQIMWLGILMLSIGVIGCGGGGSGSVIDSTVATAPRVISTNPGNTVTAVARNQNITATFSTAMDAATLSASTFTITGPGSTPVDGNVTYSGITASFNPTVDLNDTVLYTATITTGAKNLAGTSLAANYVWTFTTGSVNDTTAPDVNATNPDSNATGVPINQNITAVFSEAVDSATVNTTTFSLTDGITPVAGVVSYVGTTATFNPTSDLNVDTNYTATITTAVQDLAGNAMLADKVWTFTTGSTIANGPDPVNLGTAGNFVLLSKSGISTTGATSITGDIGVSPIDATAFTGFSNYTLFSTYATADQVTGKLYAANFAAPTPAYLTTAISDMEIAFTDAAGRTNTTATELGAGNISGMTLAPGLYKWGTGLLITGAGVTLSGGANDVWIFQIAQNLTVNSGAIITLAGGAKAKNVFWQVSGQTALGTTVQFKGNILSQTLISLNTGASLEGRTLAQTAVTLNANTIILPTP
ncbi:MAG: ice-binding family protein [Sulfuricurvum sp.]|nr:ice-binding family protein [Sulfuricurvum sp.]MDP3023367.1 ice-binding family protein [Sulfuricurvum sp.]MDP3119472.1 ice-binding family protein [Sulfuricurvum sp.]